MAHYLALASYTSEAMARLVDNPEDRGATIGALIERLGGKIETFDYCFGDYHLATVMEFPDDETMEAFQLAVYASGAIKEFKITVLIPMENAVRALTRARAADYQPPR